MNKEYMNERIETAKALTKLDIENMKEALKLFDDVVKVIQKFDGLLLNKRLDTALRKIDNRLSMSQEHSWFNIYFVDYQNRSYQGRRHTHYTEYMEISLADYLMYQDSSYQKGSLDSENRIISSVVVDTLNKNKKYIEKTIEELENSLKEDFTKHFERKKRIEKLIQEHNESLPRHLKDELYQRL